MLSTVPSHPIPVPPPFPQPDQSPRVPLAPPVVYVAPMWEYKSLTRPLDAQALPTDDDLNALGAEGWELAAVISEPTQVHLYFKRQRS